MDFAKRQLEKYGWKEGKGLGKNEDGISTAVKATLKFDNAGVGHEISKEFTNKWWENVYDNAAKNIEVCNDANDIHVKRVADEVEISTKDYSVRDFKKKNGIMEYGTFLKTAKLTQDGLVTYQDVVSPDAAGKYQVNQLSDEDLFAICGGRTAHKGARHGLNLSGKLSRIEKQEKLLMKKLQKVKLEDNPPDETIMCHKKLKKVKKLAEAEAEAIKAAVNKKKKKKRKRKSVSFSETVLEYTTQEVDDPNDESSQSQGCSSSSSGKLECKVEIHELRINDNNEDVDDPVTTDEGIELDCDVKNDDRGQESFSEMQVHHKKEKKKKKKSSKAAQAIEVDEAFVAEEGDEMMKPSVKKKKKKRTCQEGSSVVMDIDGVKKIKRKKYQHRDVSDLSDSLEECRISE